MIREELKRLGKREGRHRRLVGRLLLVPKTDTEPL